MRRAVFRRLIRSLPTRSGVIGVATCDKGLPAMMMALAAMHDLPCVLVPGGVTLLPEEGEDAGKVQSVGARFAHGEITLEAAARRPVPRLRHSRRRMPVSGHGRHLAGSRRGPGHVAAPLRAGSLRPAIWLDMARRSARAVLALEERGSCHARHSHRCVRAQRHGGARRVRRIHQPDSAPAGHRLVGGTGAPHRRGLDPRQSPDAAPRRRPAERSEIASHGTGVSGRRRAGSDAALAPLRSARYQRPDRLRRIARRHARLVGAVRTRASPCGVSCANAMASTRTT